MNFWDSKAGTIAKSALIVGVPITVMVVVGLWRESADCDKTAEVLGGVPHTWGPIQGYRAEIKPGQCGIPPFSGHYSKPAWVRSNSMGLTCPSVECRRREL